MRLADLEPRWLSPDLFIFKCPHCLEMLLSCKKMPLSFKEQRELFNSKLGEDWNERVVPTESKSAWAILGDFSNMTISPSIDASHSGHWHGFVTNGEAA